MPGVQKYEIGLKRQEFAGNVENNIRIDRRRPQIDDLDLPSWIKVSQLLADNTGDGGCHLVRYTKH